MMEEHRFVQKNRRLLEAIARAVGFSGPLCDDHFIIAFRKVNEHLHNVSRRIIVLDHEQSDIEDIVMDAWTKFLPWYRNNPTINVVSTLTKFVFTECLSYLRKKIKKRENIANYVFFHKRFRQKNGPRSFRDDLLETSPSSAEQVIFEIDQALLQNEVCKMFESVSEIQRIIEGMVAPRRKPDGSVPDEVWREIANDHGGTPDSHRSTYYRLSVKIREDWIPRLYKPPFIELFPENDRFRNLLELCALYGTDPGILACKTSLDRNKINELFRELVSYLLNLRHRAA